MQISRNNRERILLAAGDYRKKFIYLYGFLYSGTAALVLLVLNQYAFYDNFSDKAAFILGVAGVFAIFINGKIKVSALTIFILSYVFIRGFILACFATTHSYSVLNYLFPLKNWLALLLFFIIGQSIELPRQKVNTILLNIFIVTSVFIILIQLYSLLFDKNLSAFDASRLPFVKYRVGMDILLMIYAFIIATTRYLKKECSSKYYFSLVALVIVDFVSSQTKQIAVSIFFVLFYFFFARRYYAMKSKGMFLASYIIMLVVLALLVAAIIQNPFSDSYFSFIKRVSLAEYIQEKVYQYPITGYPIPSNIANGVIPIDIKNTFFAGDRSDLIYPSDLPLLAVIMEEGLLGIIFIIALLFWSYKTNSDVKYLILLIGATFLTFRMYYMVTLGSTLTYFLLGLYTRDSLADQSL